MEPRMHCRLCGRAMTPHEAAEFASQADRYALSASVEECGFVWYCDRCFPRFIHGAQILEAQK
jgi:hypothetical protein